LPALAGAARAKADKVAAAWSVRLESVKAGGGGGEKVKVREGDVNGWM
jgi:hypothetical protein